MLTGAILTGLLIIVLLVYLASVHNRFAGLRQEVIAAAARCGVVTRTRRSIDNAGRGHSGRGSRHTERLARIAGQRGGRNRRSNNGFAVWDNANGWPDPAGVRIIRPALDYGVQARQGEQSQWIQFVNAVRNYNLALSLWPDGWLARNQMGYRYWRLPRQGQGHRPRQRPAHAANRMRGVRR